MARADEFNNSTEDGLESPEPKRSSRIPTDFVRLSELLLYVGKVLEGGFGGYVWVSAEIGSLTDRKHLFMELLETGEDGREQAKTRATLFAPERFKVEHRFKRVTGSALEPGLSVLLGVVPSFHPQYGFALNVLDIAPAFTLGAAQQKLEESRSVLEREGLLELNKRFPVPGDFSKVAVLSPEKAAGLGDFRQTVDALEQHGLCDFHYFEAIFQGNSAANSLKAALERILREHQQTPFEALCIIRGGGSSLDLAWLNDLDLARAVARFPAPVLTGIGHARDETLLDEVAALRLDTPSKLAAFIQAQIVRSAAQAEFHFSQVRDLAREIVQTDEYVLERLNSHILGGAKRLLERRELELESLMRGLLGLHPERTLKRGYAVIRANGKVLTSARAARKSADLKIQFQDGELEAHL